MISKKSPLPSCLLFISFLASACNILGGGDTNVGKRTEILDVINAARSEARDCDKIHFDALPPVIWNELLAESALRHAKDLFSNTLSGHIGSDGSNPASRISDTGYDFSAHGEIVAVGSTSLDTVIDAWLESPGHCSTIMNPAFTEAGAAVSHSVWTVDFAAPRN